MTETTGKWTLADNTVVMGDRSDPKPPAASLARSKPASGTKAGRPDIEVFQWKFRICWPG